MKKIIFTILLCMVSAFAVNEPVITFKKSYNAVKTNKPAISKKITCITRVMINEGLLENGACAIDEVYVMNSKNFYIGTLATSIPAESYGTYLDYDEDGGRYHGSGKSIKVKYVDIEPEDAAEHNMDLVTCPNGMKPYIEGNAFSCKIPYSCPKNMYAYDEYTCYDLPENAVRNLKDGYSCKSGYIKNVQEECEAIVTCDSSEHYNKAENSCYEKPENSHWVSETEWSCNEGYIDIHDKCERIVTCIMPKRYNDKENKCEQTPANAHWTTAVGYDWACDNGYVQIMNQCEAKLNCTAGQKYNEYNNTCENPPENAKWDYFGNVICNAGYVMHNDECEIKANCERYDAYNNACFEKPEHSHWTDNNSGLWECNNNYHKDDHGNCFTCEAPFQYNEDTGTCISKPENSVWIYEGHWECKDGYVERHGKCEEKVSCWFSRYDAELNQCIEKPSGSHWINDYSTDWEYDKPLNLGQYFSLNHWIAFEFYGNNSKDLKDYVQYPIVMSLSYNIGTKVGNEDINVTPFIDIALSIFGTNYTSTNQFAYDGDESITSIYFKIGGGLDLNILNFLVNVNYNYLISQELENIEFGRYVIDYRFGYNFSEHWAVYFMYEANLLKNTTVLKNYTDNVMGIGVNYRF